MVATSRALKPLLPALLLGCLIVGWSAGASAQDPLRQVLDLNRQGMAQYMNLDLEAAQRSLNQALQAAQRGNINGAPLARTYLNLGVIAIGGFGDNGSGMDFFIRALQTDATLQLDPLTSTPEIQTVFTLARQRAGDTPPPPDPGPSNPPPPRPESPAPAGNLQHFAVPEQLAQTAVPIYIEVPGAAAHVYTFYRAHGMTEFRRVEMRPVADGYGYEIPCSDVFQPSLEYYIVAFADDGSPLGFAGSQQEPFSVAIVSSRSRPAPALPGMPPSETCGESECPPGMDGCAASEGGGGMGSTCRSADECASGLNCEDNFCVVGDSGRDDGSANHGRSRPMFYLQVGATLGLGLASPGMQADRFGESRALVPPSDPECGVAEGFYCVRVAQGGLVPHGGLRIQANIYPWDFLGFGVWARFAPDAGQGDHAFYNFGARVNLVVADVALGPDPVDGPGLQLIVFAGGGFGQIQIQPPDNLPVDGDAPYIISGLGNISLGGAATVRLMRNFGVFFQTDLMFQMPTFMFNIDLTLGASVSF